MRGGCAADRSRSTRLSVHEGTQPAALHSSTLAHPVRIWAMAAQTPAAEDTTPSVDNFTNDSAMMIAYERAIETKRPDALFQDPLAEALAGSKGESLSTNFENMCGVFEFEGWPTFHKTWVAVRTRYIDDRVDELAARGDILQCVNLGAGMDTRPYRLEAYRAFTRGVIDVDMAVINEGRNKIFSEVLGVSSAYCEVGTLDLDFLDAEKTLATELPNAGFDATKPTLFLSEGLIMYLGTTGKAKLLADVSAVAAPGSVFVLQFMDATGSKAAEANPEAMKNALSVDEATRELTKHGWIDLEFCMFGDDGLSYGRYPDQFKPSAAFSFCVCRKGEGEGERGLS